MTKKDMEKQKKKQKVLPTARQGFRFAITLNGPTDVDLRNIKKFFKTDECGCAVIGYETGKHHVHPHWQGYFELADRKKKTTFRERIIEIMKHKRVHIETAIGTKEQNLEYCFGLKDSKGKSKDYELGLILYKKNVEPPIGYDQKKREVNVLLRMKKRPRHFQRFILNLVTQARQNKEESVSERRKVYYFYEHEGNTGKSAVAELLHWFYGGIVLGGRPQDMKHAVTRWKEVADQYPPVIIVDMARSGDFTKESYYGIEEIKNAMFFSGKYDSTMVASLSKPIIFVFANVPPLWRYFSKDRWKAYAINPKTYQYKPLKYPQMETSKEFLETQWLPEHQEERRNQNN